MHARVLALMAVFIAAQASNICTKVTECGEKMVPLRMGHKQRELWLVWQGAADRAATALLLHVLAARGYCRLALCEVPRGLCPLVKNPPNDFKSSIVVGFETTSRLNCTASRVLDVIGEQRAPLSPRLHAVLSHAAAARTACEAAAAQKFYDDKSELHACNFSSRAERPRAYIPPEWRATNEAEVVRLLATMELQRINCTRDELAAHVNDGKHSFVFVDAELWSEEPRVRVVRSTPVTDAELDHDAAPAILCSEKVHLMIHAPTLLQTLRQYAPRRSHLRELLALEAHEPANITRGQAATRAAAVWAKRYTAEFNEIIAAVQPGPVTYRVIVSRCEEDNDAWAENRFERLLIAIRNQMKAVTQANLVYVQIEEFDKTIDCLDRDKLRSAVQRLVGEEGAGRLLGVAAAGAGVQAAAQFATQEGLALVAYDAQPPIAGATYASYLGVGARTSALANALLWVLAACGWRRVALLSEDTPAAKAVAAALRAPLSVREVLLPRDNAELQKTLLALRSIDARVFVVNAGAGGAARALAAGAAVGLTRGEGYAWVAREWEWGLKPPLPLLALRSAPRTPEDAGATRVAQAWSGPGDWPQRAAPLADAVLTLGLGYGRVLNNTNRFDHRTNETLKLLRHSLIEDAALGDIELSFDAEGAQPPPIWLELYEANNATALPYEMGNASCPVPALSDGTVNCNLYTGDEFAHRACLDLLVVLGAPSLLLAALIAAYGEAARRRRVRERVRARERLMRAEACAALLSRQRGAVSALTEWYVERERVRLLSELGTGRHGRVWLAELAPEEGKGTRDALRFVAAKEPLAGCSPAEESELLREAAALAVLRHEHVTQLVGVCVVGGPPLVLTERAFFGDLQRYLWTRRALPSGVDGEAAHVSAEALTQLAHEAALALAYLAERSLVHCDVRAANCLVDERRSLKLADFGMARELGTGEGARDDEYQCRRRKLVPVRWMPPESLTRGVFSPASDVWALGVLALELVTLGERPFGALESPEAVSLVKAGGHARLPTHCSRETRWLALACWRREAETRPSARDVAAWLAERPRALAPAPHLHYARDDAKDDDDDSGFGEEPAAIQPHPPA